MKVSLAKLPRNLYQLIWSFLLIFIPLISMADAGGPGPAGSFQIKITNPLSVSTVDELLNLVLNLIIQAGIPIIVSMIMWSGFLFIQAQGNQSDVTKAKENLKYVLIGTAIVLGVFSILAIVRGTIQALGA